MGRKKILRKVDISVNSRRFFSPQESAKSKSIILSCDELEAIRLCDLKGLYQNEAAKKMEISRATLARILFETRRKITEALLKGFSIRISKGNVKFQKEKVNCPIHKAKKRKGRICLCKSKEEY